MKKTFLLICFSFVTGLLSAQPIPEENYSNTVAVIGEQEITVADIIEVYSFNSPDENVTVENIEDFLPSYVEYKMKLKEGYDRGLDKDPDLQDELENYGQQSAYTFWIENEIKQQLIDEYIEKSRFEIKGFHILGALEPDASPEDTARVYNKMLEARDNLLAGNDIEEVDEQYSTHRNGRSMGGQLPWLRAGTTVPEFEEAIFSLSEGEISQPVRTQFGYHIIKLQEKRDRTPDRIVSHIFIQNRPDNSGEQVINEIFEQLQTGSDWTDLVAEYSEDNASVSRGGNINWVGYGSQFEEGFVDSVMETDPNLPYSEPIESVYGYHILRIDSVRTYASEEERNDELISQLQQRQNLNPDRQQVIEALKKRGNFQLYAENVNNLPGFISSIRESSFGNISNHTQEPQKVIFTFDEDAYSFTDFLAWLSENHPDQQPENYSQMWVDDFIEEKIESKLIEITSREFPEFEKELNRFMDGLIVFQISNEHVWDPETADLGSLREYYNEHKNEYRYDKRYAYYLVSARSDSLIELTHQQVSEGEHPSSLANQYEDLSVHFDSTRNSNSSSYEQLKSMDEHSLSEIFSRGVYKSFYYLDKILEPRIMTFNEAYRRIVSDYQPIREEQFMNYLRDKYKPELLPENIQ